MKVEAVERRHVRAILEPLAAKPVTANRTLAAVRAMFSHAVKSDDWALALNPAVGITAHPEAHRERYPQNGELERLVAALQRRGDRPGQFLLVLLLTGARRGELLALRWSDVDLEAGVWTKPAEVTKQRKSHRLPLNPQAVELLRELRAVEPFSPFGRLALSALRAAWHEVLRDAGIANLRVHDLRHWHASLLASMGLSLADHRRAARPREHGDDAALCAPGRRCAARRDRSRRRGRDPHPVRTGRAEPWPPCAIGSWSSPSSATGSLARTRVPAAGSRGRGRAVGRAAGGRGRVLEADQRRRCALGSTITCSAVGSSRAADERRLIARRYYAELPLSPTVEQKKAAATKHGITLHQVTRLVRARGVPVRVQGKFSRDF